MRRYVATTAHSQTLTGRSTHATDKPAYIFDLDGTLVDTAPDLLAATNAVLRDAGRTAVDPDTLRHMVGFGARSLIAQAFAATGAAAAESDLPRLVDIFIGHYRQNIAAESRPFPGVERDIGGARGHRAAGRADQQAAGADRPSAAGAWSSTASSAPSMARAGCRWPSPMRAVFHHVIEELGGGHAGAVMIGDSATDVKTARAAGVPVILVAYGYTPVPASELGGDAVTDDFAEIPALAKRLLGA